MNLEDLGRRAVACKGWRWMSGMLLLPHIDGCECCEDRNFPRRAARIPAVFTTDIDVPDLSDPATLGCLLALVREAWGRPFWIEGDSRSMGERPDEWIGVLFEGRFATCPIVHASTEAECLVAALEAAP